MAHGYTCDRCNTFVEQGRMGPTLYEGKKVEQVAVCTPTDDEGEFALNEYTLCGDCRAKLVNWVDEGEPTFPFLESAKLSFKTTMPVDDIDELTDVAGVGRSKAKALANAGYHSRRDLKKATQTELAEIEEISAPLAARIKADVGDYKSATDIVEEIEMVLDPYEGDE